MSTRNLASLMVPALVAGVASAYPAAWLGGCLMLQGGADPVRALSRAGAQAWAGLTTPWLLPLNAGSAAGALLAMLSALMISVLSAQSLGNFDPGREYGDARWATVREIRRLGNESEPWANIMYTRDCWLATKPFNAFSSKQLGAMSLNTCVIGSTGAGKGYRYIGPLVMQLVGNVLPYSYPGLLLPSRPSEPDPRRGGEWQDESCDFLITDSKGDTLREYGHLLEAAGYEIRVLDCIGFEYDRFNPFAAIPVYAVDSVDPEAVSIMVRWSAAGQQQAPLRLRLSGDERAPGAPLRASTANGEASITVTLRSRTAEADADPLADGLIGADARKAAARAGVSDERIAKMYDDSRYTRTRISLDVVASNATLAPLGIVVEADLGPFVDEPVPAGSATSALSDDGSAICRWEEEVPARSLAVAGWTTHIRAMRSPDAVELTRTIDGLVSNLQEPGKPQGDEFWANTERLFLTALAAYCFERYQNPDMRCLAVMMRYLDLAKVDMTGSVKSPLDVAFDEWEEGRRFVPAEQGSRAARSRATGGSWVPTADGPHSPSRSLALHCYHAFHQGAAETLQSILISCSTALLKMFVGRVQDATSCDELMLDSLGDPGRRQAVFLLVDDQDHSFDFLAAMAIHQAVTLNCRKANRVYGSKLPRPVHFILDEFANIATIPSFERIIAVTRSRNVVMHVILQSLNQLSSRYGDDASTIRDNCSALLFLGGQSEQTLEGLSKLSGTETVDEVTTSRTGQALSPTTRNRNRHARDLATIAQLRMLDADDAVVMIDHQRPFRGPKVDTNRHPLYRYVWSAHPRPRGAPKPLYDEPFDYAAYRQRASRGTTRVKTRHPAAAGAVSH